MRTLLPLFVLAVVGPVRADDYPKLTLKNDALSLTVYLPDAAAGYYRGTRFDWSGVVGYVKYAGHTVFGPWKDKHDPANFDDIVGPVEEFGTEAPLGYTEAKEGETFVKIGVGELVKPKEERYRFTHPYKIAKPGTWEVASGPADVSFKQTIQTRTGYGYRYAKRVALEPTGFVIGHELTNTGTLPLESDHYNHNFFNVDDDPVGPNYRVTLPAPPAARDESGRYKELVSVRDGKTLAFSGVLDTGYVYAILDGQAGKTGPVVFSHAPSGLTMTAEADVPIEKVRFWATKRTVCPEPFVAVSLKPGETKSWAVRYAFAVKK